MHILFVGAHPDDAEGAAGGTLTLLAHAGHHVRMLSVTNGDAGHYAEEYRRDRKHLAARRRSEAMTAAALIGAESACLEVHDGEVMVDVESTRRMITAIRSFGVPGQGPDLVITHRPSDYHRDHRGTARLVQDSAYLLGVPLLCPEVRHLDRTPVIAYHFDRFTEGGAFRPDVVVNVESVLETKARLLAAHESQFFEWLPFNSGRLSSIPASSEGRMKIVMDRVTCDAAAQAQSAERDRVDEEKLAYAEMFQISEYGRQPSREELAELFLQ